jgi:hypothetical protein
MPQEAIPMTDAPTTTLNRTTIRNLPVKLTEEELLKAGDELAKIVQDIGAEEDRQADRKAGMKAALAILEGRRTQVAIKISRREEFRGVRVDVYMDIPRGIVQEIRQDTGEVITTRQMTDTERQLPLPTAE